MNILIIKSSSFIQPDIEEAFSLLGHVLYPVAVPPAKEKEQNSYLQALITNIKACSPDFVFSLNFYPFISYACELLGLRYIAWLVNSYHPDYFSPAIRNGQTWLFASDSVLTEELRDLNAAHVSFLPLAAGLPRINRLLKQNYDHSLFNCDVSFFGNILSRDELNPHPLSTDNALKDSTKGYLEGCIACYHQIPECFPIAERLPNYVKNDLLAFYKPDMSETIASTDWLLNHQYFYPLITDTNREIFYAYLKNEQRLSKVKIYGDIKKEDAVSFEVEPTPTCNELSEIAFRSKINLIIPERSFHGDIPPIGWQILGAKGFLLYMGEQSDVYPKGMSNTVFRTARDMMQKIAYYLGRDKERQMISEEIYQDILEHHTCSHRIRKMLGIIQS